MERHERAGRRAVRPHAPELDAMRRQIRREARRVNVAIYAERAALGLDIWTGQARLGARRERVIDLLA
jgi:hypothetical protein